MSSAKLASQSSSAGKNYTLDAWRTGWQFPPPRPQALRAAHRAEVTVADFRDGDDHRCVGADGLLQLPAQPRHVCSTVRLLRLRSTR